MRWAKEQRAQRWQYGKWGEGTAKGVTFLEGDALAVISDLAGLVAVLLLQAADGRQFRL